MNHAAPSQQFKLPNVRKLFVPDRGYTIFDGDLSGADAQVVAWEAEDKELKQWLYSGFDMHRQHGIDVGLDTEFEKMDKSTYAYKARRQEYKGAVHATNYGASPFSLSKNFGWTVRKAEGFQERYFRRRPGVKEWHLRTNHALRTTRTITNAYGYRIIYFDRVDGLLPQALAWLPQSTVALVCFKGALRLRRELPWVQILLQVHDSVVFQVPSHRDDQTALLKRTLMVETPYPEPLVIPWGLARSAVSWGDCEKVID
jgi:DNA polymerase-1